MNITYTLSIEKVRGIPALVTIRGSNGFKYCESYDPNLVPGEFRSEGPFDTSFSVIHPFRSAAGIMVLNNQSADDSGCLPHVGYDTTSVSEVQQRLFENILTQETYKVRHGVEEAACRDFLATLPGDRVLERAGFQSRLEEIEKGRLELGISSHQGNQ